MFCSGNYEAGDGDIQDFDRLELHYDKAGSPRLCASYSETIVLDCNVSPRISRVVISGEPSLGQASFTVVSGKGAKTLSISVSNAFPEEEFANMVTMLNIAHERPLDKSPQIRNIPSLAVPRLSRFAKNSDIDLGTVSSEDDNPGKHTITTHSPHSFESKPKLPSVLESPPESDIGFLSSDDPSESIDISEFLNVTPSRNPMPLDSPGPEFYPARRTHKNARDVMLSEGMEFPPPRQTKRRSFGRSTPKNMLERPKGETPSKSPTLVLSPLGRSNLNLELSPGEKTAPRRLIKLSKRSQKLQKNADEISSGKSESVVLQGNVAPNSSNPDSSSQRISRNSSLSLRRLEKAEIRYPSWYSSAPGRFSNTFSGKSSLASLPPPSTFISSVRKVGFENSGNTCYMNAVVQCLLYVDSFILDLSALDISVLERDPLLKDIRSLKIFPSFLGIISKARNESCSATLRLDYIRSAIGEEFSQFKGNRQQDAHEFLVSILAFVNAQTALLLKTKEGAPPDLRLPSDRNFHSKINHTLTCLKCGYSRVISEHFYNLSLDLPVSESPLCREHKTQMTPTSTETKGNHYKCTETSCYYTISEKRWAQTQGNHKLENLLQSYMGARNLELNCSECQHDYVTASSQFSILPRTLILHVKRFFVNPANGSLHKRPDLVDIPETVNINDWCSKETGYPVVFRHTIESLEGNLYYNIYHVL